MKTFSFDESARSVLERSVVPMGVYQVVDGKVVTLLVTDGLCEMFGYESRAEAIEKMDTDMYWNVHPDDIARTTEVAIAFIERDEPYNLVCRVRNEKGYRIIHTSGKHVTTHTGERVAVVWYIDEGAALADATVRDAYKDALDAGAIYENIVNALSQDYFNVYYVDVVTNEYIEYGSRTEKGWQSAERRGFDFFAETRNNAPNFIYEEDVKRFQEELNKERLLCEIDRHGSYIYHYRLMIGGRPTYVSLKATRASDDRHIIIGISNVDSQVRDRQAAEHAAEERKSYLRLSALAGNLVVLYYVDPKTSEYTQFSATTSFEDLGIDKRGSDFFKSTHDNSLRTVHPDDLEMFLSHVTKENVLSTIERKGTFVLDYRLVGAGLPSYVRLKAALVNEDGRDVLIIGLMDEDARVEQEREYARSLSAAREKAIIDSLTGVKNKHAYAEWEEKVNAAIKNGEQDPFAVAVCDVNDLKTVNDLYGHKEGDACIKRACSRICKVFAHSPVFRVGGDEFTVILTKGDYDRREELLRTLIMAPEERSEHMLGDMIAAGIAEYREGYHTSLLSVFEEADKAMYATKKRMKTSSEDQETDATSANPLSATEVIPAINIRKRILIADDIESNREILSDLLEDDYDILCAADGIETLEVLHDHKDEIALVLLDLYMPRMTGREVIAEMQIDDDLMSIPVIFLTVDQDAELDCLRIGAMDFIPKPYPDIEIVKARIAKCIELSEDRDLIRHTERDRLTGLLNKEYFYRYVERLDRIHNDEALDAIVCDVNRLHAINERYGRQFGDHVLHSVGTGIRRLARQTDGIGCREGGDIFYLYCPHQHDLERQIAAFLDEVFGEKKMASRVSLRFGVLHDAQMEPDIEERFIRAKVAADSTKGDPEKMIGVYVYDTQDMPAGS